MESIDTEGFTTYTVVMNSIAGTGSMQTAMGTNKGSNASYNTQDSMTKTFGITAQQAYFSIHDSYNATRKIKDVYME